MHGFAKVFHFKKKIYVMFLAIFRKQFTKHFYQTIMYFVHLRVAILFFMLVASLTVLMLVNIENLQLVYKIRRPYNSGYLAAFSFFRGSRDLKINLQLILLFMLFLDCGHLISYTHTHTHIREGREWEREWERVNIEKRERLKL